MFTVRAIGKQFSTKWENKMSVETTSRIDYHLGHDKAEQRRLQAQHRLYSPFTRQLFVEAGIKPGMRVLDIGSGAGDVALLAAELVGCDGHVTGLELNKAMLQTARLRAAQAGYANVEFIEDNADNPALEEKFDAVVGRWVLMWLNSPVEALRKLGRLVKPGGLVIFQESIFQDVLAFPASAVVEQVKEVYSVLNKLQPPDRHAMGLSLYKLYQEAGLPAPTLRVDAAAGGGADWEGYQLLEDTLRSLLPALEKIAPEIIAKIEIETFAARLREDITRQQGAMMLVPVVGAWAKLP
jgi:ubiquinone/menaquinone biosynthesis C-methylase UbiE